MLNRILLVMTILLISYTLIVGNARESRIWHDQHDIQNGSIPVLFQPQNTPSLPITRV